MSARREKLDIFMYRAITFVLLIMLIYTINYIIVLTALVKAVYFL
jgi:hypothetical protein